MSRLPAAVLFATGALLGPVLAAAVGGQTPMLTPQKGARPAPSSFGATRDRKPVEMYTLTNANGIEIRAITYGGIITSLRTPDRAGQMADIVLGFDRLDGYVKDPPPPFFGAIIGRYGNRIARGQFTLDGKTYRLATNNGPNHLHGGNVGFDKVVWAAEPLKDANGIAFTRTSP